MKCLLCQRELMPVKPLLLVHPDIVVAIAAGVLLPDGTFKEHIVSYFCWHCYQGAEMHGDSLHGRCGEVG